MAQIYTFRGLNWRDASHIRTSEEGFDMNAEKALIEGVTQDLIIFLVEDKKTAIEEAMNIVYNSATFEKLSNANTGLYRESSAYVFELLKDELKEGVLIQKKF